METANFICLRCGHEHTALYDRKDPVERTCPKCGSNSTRLIKKRPVKPKA